MRVVRGFTLLEAIVALVIFAMGAFALYGWLSTNLITLERARVGSEALVVRQSALELLRDVNPMRDPSGERDAGALRVQWTRSEEHTSELQSLMRISYAVFCLKKTNN